MPVCCFGRVSLAKGIGPIWFTGIKTVRIVCHVSIKCISQTLKICLVVFAVVDHKLKAILLVVTSVSGRLLVKSHRAGKITSDHLLRHRSGQYLQDVTVYTHDIILFNRIPVAELEFAEDRLPLPVS